MLPNPSTPLTLSLSPASKTDCPENLAQNYLNPTACPPRMKIFAPLKLLGYTGYANLGGDSFVLKNRQNLLLLAVLLAICGVYANSFQNSFHFDDFHTVVDNPAIRSLHNVPRFFTDTTTFSVLPANRTYRPVVSTMLALDYALGHGYTPLWFHISTFLFFLGQVALLYALYLLLLDKIRPSPANAWIALFAAAWYGLHPVMAETVNYVIQRGDLYCTLGCVAALYLYARYPERRRTGLYLLPLIFALLSKPPAAVFPLLLILYVFFFEAPESESSTRRALTGLIAALPSIAVTAALMILQSAMTPKSFMPSILSAADYRLTQPFVWLRYFAALFLPLHLNADTDLPAFSTINLQVLAGLLFLALLCAAIWITARRRILYPIAYGLLWFVITQLPTSLYPLSEVENDHRMFFSFVGLVLAVVWTVALLLERCAAALTTEDRSRLRSALILIAIMVLGAYANGVVLRNRVWHDEESLMHDVALKSPHNGRGLMMYGLTLMNRGDYPDALDYFQRALVYTPNYATLEINLGVVIGAMADQGDASRTAEAESHFQRAVLLTPTDDLPHTYYGRWLLDHARNAEAVTQLQAAVSLNPQRPLQHDLLIKACSQSGNEAAAHQAALDTVAIMPDDAMAIAELAHPAAQTSSFWIDLSLAQYRQSQYPASIDSARHALQIDPKLALAYNNIGAGYAGMHQWDEAISNERQALQLDPTLQIAQNNLTLYLQQSSSPQPVKTADDLLNESLALNQAGKFEESIAAARKALQLNPNMAAAWNNIAAGYESLHRWDEAIAAANKAIALQPGFQLAKNNLAWSISQKQLAQSKPGAR